MTKDLTIFYDGGCPLCVAEMQHLHRLDLQSKLGFENIYAKDFTVRFPHIDQQQADRRLHGQAADGTMLFGLDVTYQAWALVGKRQWVAVLRWPVVKQLADIGYLFFARYRYSISRLVTGQSRCESCAIGRSPL